MTEETTHDPSQPRGPELRYSSPFARAQETTPPPASPASESSAAFPGAPPRRPTRTQIALASVGFVLLLLAASAAGASLSHEFWTNTTTTTTAAPPVTGGAGGTSGGGTGTFGGSGSTVTPGTSNGPGGISIGPGGITVTPNGPQIGSSQSNGGPANAASIASKVSPALVNINSNFSYQGGAGAGTGIVISSTGEVLTNNHVIDGATQITATDIGNGKTYRATVVGYDPTHDIAVLQLQGASGLQTARLGDSSKLSVGDAVLGLGNAGGAGGTPTPAGGTITGLNKNVTAGDELGGKSERLTGLIETSADIQPGDSGGALVDAGGNVIGMITAGTVGFGFSLGLGGQAAGGQGFVIPISQASATAAQIVSGHASATVHIGPSAFLGVELSPTSTGGGFFGGSVPSAGSGVEIGAVLPGKPAEQAGLAAGDTITSLDGHAVTSSDQIGKVLLGHHPGDTIKVAWTNANGQPRTSSVTLASGPPS